MCLCILAHQLVSTYPNIIAANREERYERPTNAPAWQDGVFAGRDRVAGGTWQGINPMGLHVALTNPRGDITDPERRSRGQLCFKALRWLALGLFICGGPRLWAAVSTARKTYSHR